MKTVHVLAAFVAVVGIAGFACAPTISTFSPVALEYATSLKVDALSLMETATQPYADHETEVAALRQDIDQAYEYARARPKNEISADQWETLKDPDRHLLGGFLRRWEQESTLSPAFVSEQALIVEDAFNTIIDLEAGKTKPGEAEGRQ